jgi:hypothetical protein
MHVMRSVLFSSALFSTAMVAVSLPTLAQTRPQVPVEVEGSIQSLDADGDGVKMKVNGVVVSIPGGVINGNGGNGVRSPTTKLTKANILNSASFPGRSDHPGFLGGMAIVIGTSSQGGVTASDVFMQPAENVILGAVTANEPGKFEVEGVPVVLLAPVGGTSYPAGLVPDDRLPGLPMKNNLGLTIKPESVPVYAEAVLEGYLGKDPAGKDTFYAFSIGSVSNAAEPSPKVSITRAQCRVRSASEVEWDVRGGISPWTQGAAVSVHPPSDQFNGGKPYATNVPVEQDTSDPKTGAFRYSAKSNVAGGCPSSVIVKFGNAPDAVASVEIK